jgi:hypothetical protein
VVFSATFAECRLHFPLQGQAHFEYGNKVLLSSTLLEELMRSEMSADGDASPHGAALGALGFEVGRQQSATSDSAMVFELLSPCGHPVYVGVAEFTAPEPDMASVPPEMPPSSY